MLKHPVSIVTGGSARTGGKYLNAVGHMLKRQRGTYVSHYHFLRDHRGRPVGYAVRLLPPPPTSQAYVSAAILHACAQLTLLLNAC